MFTGLACDECKPVLVIYYGCVVASISYWRMQRDGLACAGDGLENMTMNTVQSKVAAVAVLFRPDVTVLIKMLDSLRSQVNRVIIVDNTPGVGVLASVEEGLHDFSEYEYIPLGRNAGIAAAQNIGIAKAKELGFEFVLLMDQDSELPNQLVTQLLVSYRDKIAEGEKVAAIGPAFVDVKTNEYAPVIRRVWFVNKKIDITGLVKPVLADHIIASGSLISIDVLDSIGGMREDFFIDWVDIEWGLRAGSKGYAIYVDPRAIMKHSIGDETVSYGRKYINLHSDFRNYFIVRNCVYMILYASVPIGWRVIQLVKVPLFVLFYSIHSKKKLYSLKLLTRAIWDGVRRNMYAGFFSMD